MGGRATSLGGQRKALLVPTANYTDPTFRRLRAPDADGLAEVLTDPAIGGYQVEPLHDTVAHEVALAIENLFADAGLDDLLLISISGHGVKDATGRLYLPTINSRHDRLESTAVPAQFIRSQMDQCRARRMLVWLDCCYAGAFPPGTRHRSGEQVDVLAQLGGRGCAALTSSSALEYSYEIDDGPEAVLSGRAGPSVFTSVLIEGLRTGAADRNGDDLIDIDELYEYVFERVRATGTPQTPTLDSRYAGRLFVATSARGPRQDAPPPEPEHVEPTRYLRRRIVIAAAGAALLGGGIPFVLERNTAGNTAPGQAVRPRAHRTPSGRADCSPLSIWA